MENKDHRKETAIPTPAMNSFQKRIGKTTYDVNVHFSTMSKETLQDKIERLILNEIKQSK